MTLPAPHPHRKIIPAAEAQAWEDGFSYLERAKTESAALRDTTEAEIAKAREDGYQQGRLAGETEAAALLLKTQADVDTYLASLQPQLVELVFQILQDTVGACKDADLIARTTRHALATYRPTEPVTLSVPVASLAEVQSELADLDLTITSDRHLSGRQCILTTPASSIDISLDAQFQAIRAAMTTA